MLMEQVLATQWISLLAPSVLTVLSWTVGPLLRAGTPATIARGGMSRVTTAPAPTIAPAPMVIPHKIVAFDPIDAPLPTWVGATFQSAGPWGMPSAVVALGNLSLVNMTRCRMKNSSSIVTPSHMKVWDGTLQLEALDGHYS